MWEITGPARILVGSTSARHCRDWESGSNVFAINKNHSNMVRFDRSDENYGRVLDVLRDMSTKSSSMSITRGLPLNCGMINNSAKLINLHADVTKPLC